MYIEYNRFTLISNIILWIGIITMYVSYCTCPEGDTLVLTLIGYAYGQFAW